MSTPVVADVSGSGKVIVACKLPAGLKLEIGRLGEDNYETHTIKGTSNAKAVLDGTGFALTAIPAAFWAKWLEYSPTLVNKEGREVTVAKSPNKKLQFMLNGLVYAHQERDRVEAHATENADAKTGMEPLDPSKKLADKVEPFKAD